ALAWLLHQPVVTSVIIGAKRLEQIKDNLAATELRLSAEELQKLDAAAGVSGVDAGAVWCGPAGVRCIRVRRWVCACTAWVSSLKELPGDDPARARCGHRRLSRLPGQVGAKRGSICARPRRANRRSPR